eukprot:GHVS01081731.1.p1 GENE.GHVS01081731.1~~GHVS01081731.1.p1  ORF type:complete len:1040 (+),score=159.54 GHVS01081731.1:434-3553(+)
MPSPFFSTPQHDSPLPDTTNAPSWRVAEETAVDSSTKATWRRHGDGGVATTWNGSWRKAQRPSNNRQWMRRQGSSNSRAYRDSSTSSLNSSNASNTACFRPAPTPDSHHHADPIVPLYYAGAPPVASRHVDVMQQAEPPPVTPFTAHHTNGHQTAAANLLPSAACTNGSHQAIQESGVVRGSEKDMGTLVASVSTSVPTSPCSGYQAQLSPKEGALIPNAVWEEAVRLMAAVRGPTRRPGSRQAEYLDDSPERSAAPQTRAAALVQPHLPPSPLLPTPVVPVSLPYYAPQTPLNCAAPQAHPTSSRRSDIVPPTHTSHQQPAVPLTNVPLTNDLQANVPSAQPAPRPCSKACSDKTVGSQLAGPPASSPPLSSEQADDRCHADQSAVGHTAPSGLDELRADYLVRAPLEVCGNAQNSSRPMLNEAICRKTLKACIVKTIQKDRLSGCQTTLGKIMQIPRHPSIMKIIEVKESSDHFYVVSEKLDGGELFDYLLTEQAIPEETCKHIMRQIGTSASLLHSHNLVHRDIKPENLVFRYSRKNVKLDHSAGMSSKSYRKLHELALIDFDTCKLLTSPPEVRGGRRRLVGTYGYLAPEVLKHGHYTELSDLWSIGVILYILMTGIAPLPLEAMVGSRETLAVLLRAEKQGIDFNVSPLSDFPLARDLCRRLLCFDMKHRCSSTAEMLAHPWLAQGDRIPPTPRRRQHQSCREDRPLESNSRESLSDRGSVELAEEKPAENGVIMAACGVTMAESNGGVTMAACSMLLVGEESEKKVEPKRGDEKKDERSSGSSCREEGPTAAVGVICEEVVGDRVMQQDMVNEPQYEQLHQHAKQCQQNDTAQQQGTEERRMKQEIQYQQYQHHQCLQYQQHQEVQHAAQQLVQCYEPKGERNVDQQLDRLPALLESIESVVSGAVTQAISPTSPQLGPLQLQACLAAFLPLGASDATPSRDAGSLPDSSVRRRTLTNNSVQESQDSTPCSCGPGGDDCCLIRGIECTCGAYCTPRSAAKGVDSRQLAALAASCCCSSRQNFKVTEVPTERSP